MRRVVRSAPQELAAESPSPTFLARVASALSPSQHDVPWFPRPPPGLHDLPDTALREAVGERRQPQHMQPASIREARPTRGLDAAVDELMQYNIVRLAPRRWKPTGSVFLRRVHTTKSVFIFDLRAYSKAQAHGPVRFSLPLPTSLENHIRSNPHAVMTRIDTSRFYDSLRLPKSAPRFVFRYRNKNYQYTRVPFGWDRAPAIAQKLMLSLVRAAAEDSRTAHRTTVLVYIDDVVVLSDSRAECAAITTRILDHLRAAGLVPNLEKSALDPTPALTALGRNIDVPNCSIAPTDAARAAAARAAAYVCAAPTSARTKLSVAGALLWTSRRCLPFLGRLYAAALTRRAWLAPPAARDVCRAAALACTDAWNGERYDIIDTITPISDLNDRDIYYTDASAARRMAAFVSSDGEVRQYNVPRFLISNNNTNSPNAVERPERAQQTAELYAASKTVRVALARRRPAVVVCDSTSALWATARLSSGAFAPRRAALLARLAIACARARRHDIQFAWLGTDDMPADPATYPVPDRAELLRRLRAVRELLPPPPLREGEVDPDHGIAVAVARRTPTPPAFGGVVDIRP